MERIAFNIDEVGEMLGVSNTTIRTLLSSGRLRYTTAGERILITQQAVDEFLASPPEKFVNRPGYRVTVKDESGK